MSKKKIIILNDHPTNSGLGRYAQTIFNYFGNDNELDLKLYSLAFGYGYAVNSYPGMVLHNPLDVKLRSMLPFVRKIPDLSHYIQSRFLNRFLSQSDEYIDDIRDSILHYANPGIFPFQIDDRSIVTIHDLIFLKYHGLRHFIGDSNNKRYINSYRKIPYVLTFTNYVKKELEAFGFDSVVRNILPSVSESFHPLEEEKKKLRMKHGLPENKFLLLSVSTNRPGKNLRVIKETMDVLGDNYKLVRVGSPVGDSINFKHVTDRILNELYNASDALIFPSIEEGLGYPVIEAFATGLPVVASNIEVMKEVCNGSAILEEPVPSKMAESVKSVEANSNIFRKLSLERSKLFRMNKFTEEISTSDYTS